MIVNQKVHILSDRDDHNNILIIFRSDLKMGKFRYVCRPEVHRAYG